MLSLYVLLRFRKEIANIRIPADFGRRYAALLRNGFDAPANELIRKFMSFGLDNQTLLRCALELMEQRTKELALLYKKLNQEKDKDLFKLLQHLIHPYCLFAVYDEKNN